MSTEIATTTPAQEIATQLRGEEFRGQLAAALPEGISVDRFARVTITALMEDAAKQSDKSKQLIACDRASLYQAVIKCAQDGLLPDGREAALVKRGSKAVYQPMVGGFRKIAGEHGWTIRGTAVYANDDVFEHTTEPQTILHRPARVGADRGDVVAAYAVARHRDGRREQVVMTGEDIAKRRAIATTDQVWSKWPAEMAEKTVVRALFAELPLDPSDQRIARVLALADDLAPGEALQMLYGPHGAAVPLREVGPVTPGVGAGQQAGGGEPGEAVDHESPSSGPPPAPGDDIDFGAATGDEARLAELAADHVVHVPNKGTWVEGLTLSQVHHDEERDGLAFFAWVFESGLAADDLVQAARAFCRVHLPGLIGDAS